VAWVKVRHAGSVLGLLWTLLNPVFFIATYWLVFTRIIRVEVADYPLFMIPGFLAWNFSLVAVTSAAESILNAKELIARVAFPRQILVIASVLVAFLDLLVALAVYVVVLLVTGTGISPAILMLPVILLAQILLTVGAGLILATVAVYFRDTTRLIQVIAMLLFFATPILYPLAMIPEPLRTYAWVNPMTPIVMLYQTVLYEQRWPDPVILCCTLGLGIVALVVGLQIFARFEHSFAEIA
jgi:lipopolysaccharide transport system permease protein